MKQTDADTQIAALLAANPDLQLAGDSAPSPRRMARRVAYMTESAMQMAVIAECERRALADKRWAMCFAIPNGGHRHPAVAAKLKTEGVKPGVPDLMLPVPNHSKGFCGAFFELKVGRNRQTPNQVTWASNLSRQGYFVAVVYDDPAEVITLIEWYLSND